MKKIFLIITGIFLISLASAFSICIDHTPPSASSNLVLTASENNIQLTWTAATDEPACSGISHYDIYKNNNFLISVGETNYLDSNLIDGTYIYTVYAFDLAGHNEGVGISKTITLGGGNGGTPGGGGGGGGGHDDSSYWQCGGWSKCINGTQTRVCEDLEKNLPNRTETKICFSDFVSLDYEAEMETENQETSLKKESQSFKSFFTGAVTGVTRFAKTGKGSITFVGLIVIITGLILVRRLKK